MAEFCLCDTGVNGFGVIDCYGKPDRDIGIAFQALKSGGVENAIAPTLDQATWESLLWSKDASQRISLLNDVKAYTSERDDAVTETIDTIEYYISEGKKMVSFEMIGMPVKLKAYIESLRCQKTGFYGVTASGQLRGLKKAVNADNLYLIPIQKGTITAKVIDKTKETLGKMMVTFQIDENVNDADVVFIPSTEITADLIDTEALIQAEAVTSGTSTTTTTTQEIQLNFSLSGIITSGNLESLQNFDTVGYFDMYNDTTSTAIVPSAVSESSTVPGLYTLTFAAQTTSDVIEFSASSTAPFNFTAFTKTSL